MNMSAASGSVALVLSAVCWVLFLSCAAPPGLQQPARTQAAPPPADNQVQTPADSEANGPVIAEQGGPQVMVVVKLIPRDDIIAVTDGMLEPETMEGLIADAFRARGFPVADYAKAREHIKKDQLRRMLEGDDRAAAEVGLGAEADVVVAGSVQESSEQRAPTSAAETPDVVRVRLATRAINTATGSALGSMLLELEGLHGMDEARQRAADSAVFVLSAMMREAWNGRTSIAEIHADNADYQRVELLKSTILREVRGVDSVVTRSLDGRSAVIEVFSALTSDELLARLDRCTTALPFAIKGLSGTRIDIRFLDAPEECKPDLK
jgi:hypothetical protein